MSDDKIASMKIARIVQALVKDKRTHPAAPGSQSDAVPSKVAAATGSEPQPDGE